MASILVHGRADCWRISDTSVQ